MFLRVQTKGIFPEEVAACEHRAKDTQTPISNRTEPGRLCESAGECENFRGEKSECREKKKKRKSGKEGEILQTLLV